MATYEDLLNNLVDGDDPPVPQRRTPLMQPTGAARTKHVVSHLLIAAVVGLIAGAFFYYQHPILGGAVGLFAVLMLYPVFSSDYWIAACPYCSAMFDTLAGLNPTVEGKAVQCKQCFEYSACSGGRLVPHDPNAVSEVPTFASPVFQRGLWPKGCVACGAPPTRLDELKAHNVNMALLVTGRVLVSSGKATGIPYCDQHRDAVELKIDQQRRMSLEWCSLRMMRRYLAVNRKLGRQPAGRKWI
jgi:hypothetical protein